jgi:hypothetical protein
MCRALLQQLVRHLSDVALGEAQDFQPFTQQFIGRQRLASGTLYPDETCDIIKVLGNNELVASGDYRHHACAKLQ